MTVLLGEFLLGLTVFGTTVVVLRSLWNAWLRHRGGRP